MAKTENESKAYSLWIMPLGSEAFGRLATLISNISDAYSPKGHPSPDFDPHITLLGGIEGDEETVKEKTKKTAAELNSFDVRLDGIGQRDEYFRALFFDLKNNAYLKEANAIARKTFGLEPDPNYEPHMSVIYGRFEKEKKREMAETWCKRYKGMSFVAEWLFLYSTDGKVGEWHEVAEFRLPG
jgi:2'-5' RNA ligase